MQKETWQNGDNECEKKRTLDKTENNFKKKSRRKRGFLGQPVRRRLKRSKRLNHDPPTRVRSVEKFFIICLLQMEENQDNKSQAREEKVCWSNYSNMRLPASTRKENVSFHNSTLFVLGLNCLTCYILDKDS